MARVKARYEPLPLVPATCTTGGSLRSGCPSAASKRSMRPSDRSIDCGCSFFSRSSSVSLDGGRRRASARPKLCGNVVKSPALSVRLRLIWIGADRGVAGQVLVIVADPVEAVAAQRDTRWRRLQRDLAVDLVRNGDIAAGAASGQEIADAGKRAAQRMAMNHHVDHAVVMEIFGTLEPVGKLLADSLLDNAWPGEANQRAWLGDMDVTEHGVRGGHSTGRRMGQHHNVRKLRLAQLLHRNRGARHLHERENALL